MAPCVCVCVDQCLSWYGWFHECVWLTLQTGMDGSHVCMGHSFRIGTALTESEENGAEDSLIQISGRWKSNDLTYKYMSASHQRTMQLSTG